MVYIKFKDGVEWTLPAESFNLIDFGWEMVTDYWRI